jgi:hypothetical protein
MISIVNYNQYLMGGLHEIGTARNDLAVDVVAAHGTRLDGYTPPSAVRSVADLEGWIDCTP